MPRFPHHADHVGSLLRPERLANARQAWRDGNLPADELRALEDECITDLVEHQQAIGLGAITDGELRRDWWHLDFLAGFEGIGLAQRPRPKDFQGEGDSPPIPVVQGKVRHTKPIFVDAFSFLSSITTKGIPKITIPGPGMASFMGGRAAIDQTAYPDLDEYWSDLVEAYRDEIAALYAAGCRYLQLDDVSFAYLCDPEFRQQMAARGDDADAMITQHRDAMNAVLAGRPDDLIVSTHMCRGNFKSRWVASGGYEPIAERIFGGLDVDAFFLEFDSERAGGFEPLRHLAAGKTAVLGLITSKTPELEPVDEIKRRIDEAAAIVPLEQLALSPQCGFSSTHHGNDLTADEQWKKLDLVVNVSQQVWS
ncbi:MAG: 5-methyltetrahydropteroyltriglutamate--homocysteine S-methyltransferase [Actinobacteria bacterium]|nr:5-methyltetrahydropteroyltriglutamate--homocysteine S-methyltransferase [Actinomycetota bacterium]